jgi:hypothetical protein
MKNFTKRLHVLLIITAAILTMQNVHSQIIAEDVDLSGSITQPGSYTADIPDATTSILFDNGPVFNSTGTGSGGANESIYYQGGTATYGSGCQYAINYYLADDFTIPAGKAWTIDSINFYSYQTNSTTVSTITGIYVRIWNGNPGEAGSAVIWGDMTTNIIGNTYFVNVYRVSSVNGGTDRPVMKVVANTTGLSLNAGTYWVEWACTGTLSSGPWAPPVVTTVYITGNAIQTLDGGGTYHYLTYNTYGQGFPFVVNGVESDGPFYFNFNTNGVNNSYPFNIETGKEIQMLYLPGEFNQPVSAPSGEIGSISFRISDTYHLGPWIYSDLEIKMGQSDITTFPVGYFYSPLTTVYYRPSVTLTGQTGSWMTIILDTPFAYDNTKSLIIDVGQCGVPDAVGFSLCYTSESGNRRNWSIDGCPFVYYGTNASMVHLGITMNCMTPTITITGNDNVCANTGTNIYSTEPGMNNYTWAVSPGNQIIGNQNTDQLEVSWQALGSQWLSVTYTTPEGCTAPPTIFNVNVIQAPVPTISGLNHVCESSNYYDYTTEPGMTNYVWDITPNSGTVTWYGSNLVTIFWNSPGNKWVSVNYTNAGGCSAAAPTIYNVDVDPAPPAPEITLEGTLLTSNASTGNQWYKNGSIIAGATAQTYNVVGNGYYWDVVTLNGCSSQISNIITITNTGISDSEPDQILNIFPNPSKGKFTLAYSPGTQETFDLSILNNLGAVVHEQKTLHVDRTIELQIDISVLPPGVYSVVLKTENQMIIRKIVIK